MGNIYFMDLGRISYSKGLEIQKKLFHYLHNNDELDGFFLIVEHNSVFTIGKSGGSENLLCSKDYLDQIGIDIHESNRGGNITYHGPGQIVGYPILNLNKFKKDVHWYVHKIEEVVIKTLNTFSINSGRKEKYTGVWVEDEKICAIGIAIKRWITMHGFALNNEPNMEHFNLINPCGITEFDVTSIKKLGCSTEREKVISEIKKNFQETFNCILTDKDFEEVRTLYE